MPPNPDQLLLLADDIKLSLLEHQRASASGDDESAHHAQVSESLDQLRRGIDELKASDDTNDALPQLQRQLDDLTTQLHGFSSPAAPAAADMDDSAKKPKNVRFSDTPSSPSEELFGRYRDDPRNESEGYRDVAEGMDNQQMHAYHNQIMEEQDEHLDRLGESIGRQRELSMQIGDELDHHVAMLDEVDDLVDRHQSRLDRAKKVLGKVARAASENGQMTTIIVLIIILVLLIAVFK